MNRKSTDERTQILACLVEGNSIRGTSRLCGCSKDTVMKFLVEVGEACADYQDRTFLALPCKRLQIDEIWSFVYSKRKNTKIKDREHAGDFWTWTAVDPDSKLVPCWAVGPRTAETGSTFLKNVAARMANRVQLTTDALSSYEELVLDAFGKNIDYAQLVKIYGTTGNKGYGSTRYLGATKTPMIGNPDVSKISTSHVERQNLTIRMSVKRFARKTNAFSKKVDNHCAALAIHFMYFNFARKHKSLPGSPAMAAGIEDGIWTLEEIVEMSDAYWTARKQNEQEAFEMKPFPRVLTEYVHIPNQQLDLRFSM